MTVISPARRTKVTAAASVFALGLSLAVAPESLAQDAKNPVTSPAVAIGATATDMHFTWQTSYAGQEFVKVYPSGKPGEARVIPADGTDSLIRGKSRKAAVSGLKAGAEYTYQLGSDTGGWSTPATFRTQAPGNDWNFLHFSDAQIGVDTKVAEQAEAWRTAVRQATSSYPNSQFILHSGDQVEGWGVPAKQWNAFYSAEQVTQYPLALAKGNHETYTKVEGPVNFRERTSFPNQKGEANYFFERNNVLFIVLDTNENDNAAIQRHAQFLRETAAAKGNGKDWIIVSFHHAPYSHGGRYGTDDRVTRVREGLSPVLSEIGADLVLTGHDHMYNRTHLMNGTEPVIPEAQPQPGDVLRPKGNEVVYMTTTTAGGGKYYHFHDVKGTERKEFTNYTQTYGTEYAIPEIAVWQQDYTPDYANIEVSKNQLKVSTFNVADNSLVDEFTIDRSEKPTPSGGNGGNGGTGTKPGDGDTQPGDGGTKPGDGGSSDNGDNDAKDGSGDGSSLSTGGIIGIVVAGILALVAGVVALQPQIREIAKQFGINL